MSLVTDAQELLTDVNLLYDNLPGNDGTQELHSRIAYWLERAARMDDDLGDAAEVVRRIMRSVERPYLQAADRQLIRAWCLTILAHLGENQHPEPF